MKGDIETAREISALTYMYNNLPGSDKLKQRWVYFMVNKLSPSILNSNYVRSILSDVINDFDSQKYPVSLSQLDISGDDLMAIGLKGKAIGEMLNKLLNLRNTTLAFPTHKLKNEISDKMEVDYLVVPETPVFKNKHINEKI
jgi:hypothetical protein